MAGLDTCNSLRGNNNLRFVKFYTCNCDLEWRTGGRRRRRYVLEAILEMGVRGKESGKRSVVNDFEIIPSEPRLLERLSTETGTGRGSVEGCPFDVVCPLINPRDIIRARRIVSSRAPGHVASHGTSIRGEVKRYYVFVCMDDNLLLELLYALRTANKLTEEELRNLLDEKLWNRKDPSDGDVRIHYIQEHPCPSENTLIEIYLEVLGHSVRKRVKSAQVELYGLTDEKREADLEIKDIRCPLRKFLSSRLDDTRLEHEEGSKDDKNKVVVSIYVKEMPLGQPPPNSSTSEGGPKNSMSLMDPASIVSGNHP